MALTQVEADLLLKMQKRFARNEILKLGEIALNESHELISLDGREKFALDIWRGRISLSKYSFNHRARSIFVLARVDIGGSPHRNPDGVVIPCPHVHLYREGFGDKWAYAAAEHGFSLSNDMVQVFEDFARFCSIVSYPAIQLKYVN